VNLTFAARPAANPKSVGQIENSTGVAVQKSASLQLESVMRISEPKPHWNQQVAGVPKIPKLANEDAAR
jgi:hypothetical protein